MMIRWIPLEMLDCRYTTATRELLQKKLPKATIISGEEMVCKPSVSQFLHPAGTIFYKATQIQKIAKLFLQNAVQDGDVFFIDDIWMPGIESIQYMARMSGVHVKVCGICHAGSHTPTDDVATRIRQPWVTHFERAAFTLCDEIYVGSAFHKKELLRHNSEISPNVIVTGLIFSSMQIRSKVPQWEGRRKLVVFPHRLHPEKQPELFLRISDNVRRMRPDISFIMTHSLNLSKKEYYALLGSARLVFSAALQENFGYACLEAAAMGCDLLLPERCVYPEFYSPVQLYKPDEENIEALSKRIIQSVDCVHFDATSQYTQLLEFADSGIDRICARIHSLHNGG